MSSVQAAVGRGGTSTSSSAVDLKVDGLPIQMEIRPAVQEKLFKKVHIYSVYSQNQLNPASLMKSFDQMERVIVSNIYEPLQFIYRGSNTVEVEDKKGTTNFGKVYLCKGMGSTSSALTIPTVKLLWGFKCDFSRHRSALCMTWNKQNRVHKEMLISRIY
jgi:hypothetical protein